MEAAGLLRHPASRCAYPVLVGLLASTGLRVSEAISLGRGDVTASEGLVRVTRSKFGKSREVPLHPSAAAALGSYAQRRDELFPRPQAGSFLLSSAGAPLVYRTVLWVFGRLLVLAGGHARARPPPPRIHRLRHSFALSALAGGVLRGPGVWAAE